MAQQIGEIFIKIEGKDVGLSQLLLDLRTRAQTAASSMNQFASAVSNASSKEQIAQASALRHSQQIARLQSATGDTAGAIATLTGALSRNTLASSENTRTQIQLAQNITKFQRETQRAADAQIRAAAADAQAMASAGNLAGAKARLTTVLQQYGSQSTATIRAQSQLNNMMNQGANASNSFNNTLRSMKGALATLGLAVSVQQFVSFTSQAINAANQLEKTKATVEALSGTQQRYFQVLQLAQTQQAKFGGTLDESLDSLGQFVNLSNRTGASLQQLENMARRLAIIDPLQGFKGSSIALKEFFAGDITSLVRRFEIPRDMLNEIKNSSGSAQDKLNALDSVLTKLGISQQLLEARTKTTAATYDRLGAALDNTKNKIGAMLAETFAPLASSTTQILTVEDQVTLLSRRLVIASTDWDVYKQKVQEVNEELVKLNLYLNQFGLGTQGVQELSKIEFDFLKGLEEQGKGAEEVAAAMAAISPMAQRLQTDLKDLNGVGRGLHEQFINDSAGAREFQFALFELSRGTAENRAFAEGLLSAVENNQISMRNATIVAREHEGQMRGMTPAVQLLTDAFDEETQQQLVDQIATQTLAVKKRELDQIARNTASSIASGAETTAQAAARLGASAPLVLALANAYLALWAAQRGETQAKLDNLSTTSSSFDPRRVDEDIRGFKRSVQKEERDEARAAAEEARQAEVDYQTALGNTTDALQREAAIRADLEKRGLTESKEYYDSLLRTHQLEEQNARNSRKNAGVKLSAQEKLNNSLLNAQDKINDRLLSEEEKYEKRVLKLKEEYAEKLKEQQEKNEVSKRRSRFDFYSDLQDAQEAGVDVTIFAQQYEEAFAKAQQIAQEGNAQLAQDYLELRQKHIQELQELEQERAEILANEDLTQEQKQQQIEYLEARKRLLEEAQAEEQKQLLEHGDELNEEYKNKLEEEYDLYSENVDRIIAEADRAADSRISAWERANKRISELPPAEGKNFNIPESGNTGSGSLPSTNDPAPVKPTDPVDINAPSGGIAIAPGQILEVFDQAIVNSIADQTARLETKLIELRTSVDSTTSTLGTKIDDVKNAIRSLRTASLVGS